MQATTTGANRTGTATAPDKAQAMADAVLLYSPPSPIDTADSDADRSLYITEADALGSVPPSTTRSDGLETGLEQVMSERPELLLDKIGERIAFERGGTRLYDALIVKVQAAMAAGAPLPRAADALLANGEDPQSLPAAGEESAFETLTRIRDEELEHFHLLCEAMQQLGGDPTAMTPCADAVATASAGLMQVVTDPRTTLAQSLNAMLTAELSDHAGWELLIQLAEQCGQDELTGRFLGAFAQEAQHLLIVRNWLRALVMAEDASVLV